MEQIKVVGKINIPDIPKHKCICHECGAILNDNFGDPRHKITTFFQNGKKKERLVCDVCADENYPSFPESHNIFDGRSDYLSYAEQARYREKTGFGM